MPQLLLRLSPPKTRRRTSRRRARRCWSPRWARASMPSRCSSRCGAPASSSSTIPMPKWTSSMGVKTLFLAVGASLKGFGDAGITIKDELARAGHLLDAAKSRGILIVVLHMGGEDRRDALSNQLIELTAPRAQQLIIRDDSDADGLFAKIAKDNKIPLADHRHRDQSQAAAAGNVRRQLRIRAASMPALLGGLSAEHVPDARLFAIAACGTRRLHHLVRHYGVAAPPASARDSGAHPRRGHARQVDDHPPDRRRAACRRPPRDGQDHRHRAAPHPPRWQRSAVAAPRAGIGARADAVFRASRAGRRRRRRRRVHGDPARNGRRQRDPPDPRDHRRHHQQPPRSFRGARRRSRRRGRCGALGDTCRRPAVRRRRGGNAGFARLCGAAPRRSHRRGRGRPDRGRTPCARRRSCAGARGLRGAWRGGRDRRAGDGRRRRRSRPLLRTHARGRRQDRAVRQRLRLQRRRLPRPAVARRRNRRRAGGAAQCTARPAAADAAVPGVSRRAGAAASAVRRRRSARLRSCPACRIRTRRGAAVARPQLVRGAWRNWRTPRRPAA